MEDMPALASSNAVLMRYTALENSLVCQPQNVNMAGRVFGGYLSKYVCVLCYLRVLFLSKCVCVCIVLCT